MTFTLPYLLMFATGIAIICALYMAFRDRSKSIWFICAAIMFAVGSVITAFRAIDHSEMPPSVYEAARLAASQNAEVDAIVQTSLEDKKLSAAELGLISETYRETTGQEFRDLIRKETP